MAKLTAFSSLFLTTSMLAACGGGGGGGDSSDPETYHIAAYNGIGSYIELDEKSRTFSWFVKGLDEDDNEIEELYEGDYNPSTGKLTPKTCESSNVKACQDFDPKQAESVKVSDLLSLFVGETEGDGLVQLPKNGLGAFIGRDLVTDAAELPAGTDVVYSGSFIASSDNEEDDFGDFEPTVIARGDAETVVDFDNGKLDASFTNFDGPYAGATGKLKGATIKETEFSGGEFSLETSDGLAEDGETKAYGAFFGEDAQEVGGSLQYDDEDNDVYLAGSWNGTKQ